MPYAWYGHLGITRHVAPEQAWFETEYFLTLTEDGPPLLNLISQCFQDVGLTKWNKVVGRWCLNDNDLAKASFKKWTRDYRGSHQVVQRRQPTDSLAFLHSKEACIHVDTWIHATLDTAIQLPWQWLLPSNNGAANSAGEEQTDLFCATQRHISTSSETNMTVCHLHYTKSEEQNNNDDMNSSD